MQHHFTKAIFITFLVLSQLIFLPPSSAAQYNNNAWQQQQAAQRDARMAADRARMNARMAANRAKIAALRAAENAKREALRAADNAKQNAKNVANQNKINALRSTQNQNLLKNQKIQNARILQKTTQNLQKQRAMERAVQKTIQNQKQQVANDNQLKIKQKLNKLKELKQRKDREKRKKDLANKNKNKQGETDVLVTQTLKNAPPRLASNQPQFSEKATKRLVDPKTIIFSQDSINGTFKDGRSVRDLAASLKNGSIKPEDVPAIRTVERNGQLVSIDNRRLSAFREAGIPIRTRPATAQEILQAQKQGKFSAGETGSDTIRIRRQ